MSGDVDLESIFEGWVSTDLKVQVIAFFHRNPGLIETLEGLAKRMGTTPEALRGEIDAQVKLGIIRERSLGDKSVLTYDRSRHDAIERTIARKLEEKLRRSE